MDEGSSNSPAEKSATATDVFGAEQATEKTNNAPASIPFCADTEQTDHGKVNVTNDDGSGSIATKGITQSSDPPKEKTSNAPASTTFFDHGKVNVTNKDGSGSIASISNTHSSDPPTEKASNAPASMLSGADTEQADHGKVNVTNKDGSDSIESISNTHSSDPPTEKTSGAPASMTSRRTKVVMKSTSNSEEQNQSDSRLLNPADSEDDQVTPDTAENTEKQDPSERLSKHSNSSKQRVKGSAASVAVQQDQHPNFAHGHVPKAENQRPLGEEPSTDSKRSLMPTGADSLASSEKMKGSQISLAEQRGNYASQSSKAHSTTKMHCVNDINNEGQSSIENQLKGITASSVTATSLVHPADDKTKNQTSRGAIELQSNQSVISKPNPASHSDHQRYNERKTVNAPISATPEVSKIETSNQSKSHAENGNPLARSTQGPTKSNPDKINHEGQSSIENQLKGITASSVTATSLVHPADDKTKNQTSRGVIELQSNQSHQTVISKPNPASHSEHQRYNERKTVNAPTSATPEVSKIETSNQSKSHAENGNPLARSTQGPTKSNPDKINHEGQSSIENQLKGISASSVTAMQSRSSTSLVHPADDKTKNDAVQQGESSSTSIEHNRPLQPRRSTDSTEQEDSAQALVEPNALVPISAAEGVESNIATKQGMEPKDLCSSPNALIAKNKHKLSSETGSEQQVDDNNSNERTSERQRTLDSENSQPHQSTSTNSAIPTTVEQSVDIRSQSGTEDGQHTTAESSGANQEVKLGSYQETDAGSNRAASAGNAPTAQSHSVEDTSRTSEKRATEAKAKKTQIINLEDIESDEIIAKLSIRQMKEILKANYVECQTACEKDDLVNRLKMLWSNARQKSATPEEEAEIDREDLCQICLSARRNCVFLECGHMISCTECGRCLKECPICRQYIVRIVRVMQI